MKIGIIGLGFVGLSFATVLGSKGYQVLGIDSDKIKIEQIKSGKPPFYEPKLEILLKQALKKKLKVFSSIDKLNDGFDIVFVTVGTPSLKNGEINLSMIKIVAEKLGNIIKNASNNPIIVIKSTVIPGTIDDVVKPILEKKSEKKAGIDFGLISNPEFLRESQAILDTVSPHIVVLGSDKNKYQNKMVEFYKKFHEKVPIIQTNSKTAEMIKYANNSFLATKISFINQIAKICENVHGANIEDVAKAIGMDPRIGNSFLNAGPGYGGSCLPKDIKAMIDFSNKIGVKPSLLNAVEKANENQIEHIIKLIEKNCGELKGKTISIFGLAFKPNTDDVRDSISLIIIEKLLKKHANIIVHDTMAIDNTKKIFKNKIRYTNIISECLKDSYCLVIMTAWPEYSKITNKELKNMKKKVIIDTRRVLNNIKLDCKYKAIGVGN